MADSSSRRRSPESSRRRRRERRAASRERTNATTADFPSRTVLGENSSYYDAQPGPTMEDRSAPIDMNRPPQQNFNTNYRGRPGSSSSGSSSTSSSLLDISRRYSGELKHGSVFQTFFRAPSERRRLRRRRSGKKKKRVLYFGNSSSSSLNSDLAYGQGYIPRRKSSRDFSQRHHHQNSAPVAATAAAAAAGATYATTHNAGPTPSYPSGPSQYGPSHGHSQSYSHPPPPVQQESSGWGSTATAAVAGATAAGLAAEYYNADRQIPSKPATPRRRKTDDEIMAIGRQLSDLAKARNDEDLRAAGISKPSGLVSAATKISDYRNSKHGTSRGLGASRIDSSSDDSDWESASDDDDSEDSADSDLAFGTVVSAAIRPTAAAAAGAAAGAAMASGSRNRDGRSAVDPSLFGPVNSLHGMVTPRPFDENGKPIHREPRPLTRSATEPMGPMRNVYPMATSDPRRFDAVDLPQRARPGPVPLQQPTPRQTVSPKVYDAEKLEDATRKVDKPSRKSEDSTNWGGIAAAGVAAGLAGAALTKDRKDDRDYRDDEKRDLEKRSERSDKREKEREKDRDREKDEKRKSKRDSYSSKYDKYDDKEREKDKDEKRKSKRDSYSSKYSDDKDRDKDRKRSSKTDDRDDKKSQVSSYKRRGKDEPDDGRSELSRVSRRDSSKYNLPAKYDQPQEPRQLPGPEKAGSTQAMNPDLPLHEAAVDPFKYQVEDFAQAPPAEAPRPLTPNVFTVDREPVWDSTDDELSQGRLSRKDSFEIEQMVEGNRKRQNPEERHNASDYITQKAEHAVAPVGAAVMAGAIIAEGVRSKDRKRDAYSDNGSEVRVRDSVQDEADRYYREAETARKIASDKVRSSRDHSPDRSVVDKYDQDDNVRDIPRIVTPPEYKKHEHNEWDKHADFEIDNRWTPSEAARYAGNFNEPIKDAERERPYLNLIYPTPASSRKPTPANEIQEEKPTTDRDNKDATEKDRRSKDRSGKSREKTRDETSKSDVGSSKRRTKDRDERSSKSEVGVSSSRRRRTQDYEEETSKSDVGAVVVVGPDGEVQTPKSVSWGENRTDTFEVVTPEPHNDRELGNNKSRPILDKSSQWGAIATAIAANGREPHNEPTITESPKEMDANGGSRDMAAYHVEDAPPVPGPKPASPSPRQMPGGFEDDIEFAATLAAGLEKTGFDANMVIDDPTYRRRDSPPGSNELNSNGVYQKPFSETVSDLPSREPQPGPSEPGFVLGEVETPQDKAIDPADEFAEVPTKLSKKERKRQEKLKKQQEAEAALDPPAEATEPLRTEEEPPVKLSKKEQRKRDKEARARGLASEGDEMYTEPEPIKESEPDTYQDAWEESSSKRKSHKSRDYDDGATSVSVPIEAYADLTSSRGVNPDYEWDDDDKKSKRKSKSDSKTYDSMSKSVDDLALSSRSQPDDDWEDAKKASKKKSKRDSLIYDSPSRSVNDLSKIVEPEEEDDKKSRRRSKRDSGAYDSPSRSAAPSEAGSEVSRKSSKKSKRRSGTGDDFDEYGDHPPDRGRYPFEDRDVSSVVSEPRDDKRSSRRSYRYEDDDDAKSVVSAPGGGRSKDKDLQKKRSSGGLFSSIFKKDDNKSKESFLDNAGTLGAGVGLAGVGIAAADALSRHNATETLSEKKDPSEEIADWSRGVQDDFDPGIVARAIKPAIDPQYGDLLPLPPSEPGSPVKSPEEELPSLPESRPDTPPDQQNRSLHSRRKSAQETPVKSPSNTAIPFQLRLGNRSGPSSPAFYKSSPAASPQPGMPESPGSARKSRPTSWDDSREYKPLYLLEHNRQGPEEDPLDSADLPALPPSEASSRSSPGPGSEAWESADEYARDGYDQTGYDEPTLRLDTSLPAFQPSDERAGSQETTPKAEVKPEFPDVSGTDTKKQASEPDPIEPMSKDRSSYLLQSAPSSTKSNKTVDNDALAQNLHQIAETPSKPGNNGSLAYTDEALASGDDQFSDAREDGALSPSRSRDLSVDTPSEAVTAPETPAEQSSADATPAPEEPEEDIGMLSGKAKKKAKKAAKKKQALAVDVSGPSQEPETEVPAASKEAPIEQHVGPEVESAEAPVTEKASEEPAEDDESWAAGLSKSQKKKRKKQMEKEKELQASAQEAELPVAAGAAAIAVGGVAAVLATGKDDQEFSESKALDQTTETTSEAVEDTKPVESSESVPLESAAPVESTAEPSQETEEPQDVPVDAAVEPEVAAELDTFEPAGKKSKKKKKKGKAAEAALDPEPASLEKPADVREAEPDLKSADANAGTDTGEVNAEIETTDKSAPELDTIIAEDTVPEPEQLAEPAPESMAEEPDAWEATGKKGKKKKKKGKAPLPVDEEATPTEPSAPEPEATLLESASVEDKSAPADEQAEAAADSAVPEQPEPSATSAAEPSAEDSWSAPPLSKKEKKKQKKKAMQADDSWIKDAEEDTPDSAAKASAPAAEESQALVEDATVEDKPTEPAAPLETEPSTSADVPIQAEDELAPVSKKKKKKDKKKALQLQLDTPEETKPADTHEEPLTAIAATGDDASAWDQTLQEKEQVPRIGETSGKGDEHRGLQSEVSENLFSQNDPSASTTQDPSTQATESFAGDNDASVPAESAWDAPSSKKKDKKKKKQQQQAMAWEEPEEPKTEESIPHDPQPEQSKEPQAETEPDNWTYEGQPSQQVADASYLEPIAEDEEVPASYGWRRYEDQPDEWDHYEQEAETPRPADDGWDMDDDFFSKPTEKEEVTDDLGWDKPQTAAEEKDEPSEDEWSTLVTGKKAKKNKKKQEKLSMERALDTVHEPTNEADTAASSSRDVPSDPTKEEKATEDDWATPTKKSKKDKKKKKAAASDEPSASPEDSQGRTGQDEDPLESNLQEGMSTPRPPSASTEATEIWQEAESEIPEDSKPEEERAAADDTDFLFAPKLSKKDKKKKKQQAALEAAAADDDKSAEPEAKEETRDAESVAGTTDDSPDNTSGFVTPAESVSGEAIPDDEWGGFSSKKSKKEKKKKKAKDSESEPQEPTTTTAERTADASPQAQSQDDRALDEHAATGDGWMEPRLDAQDSDIGLSKQEKKQKKQAKSLAFDTPEDPTVEEAGPSTDTQADDDTPVQQEEEEAAIDYNDWSSGPSKKDKKKKRKSVTFDLGETPAPGDESAQKPVDTDAPSADQSEGELATRSEPAEETQVESELQQGSEQAQDSSKQTGTSPVPADEEANQTPSTDAEDSWGAPLSKKDKKRKKKAQQAAAAAALSEPEPAVKNADQIPEPGAEVQPDAESSTTENVISQSEETIVKEDSAPEPQATAQDVLKDDTAPETTPAADEDDMSWAVGLSKSQIKKRKKQMEKEMAEREAVAAAGTQPSEPASEEQLEPATEAVGLENPNQEPAAADPAVEEPVPVVSRDMSSEEPSQPLSSWEEAVGSAEPKQTLESGTELEKSTEVEPAQQESATEPSGQSPEDDMSWTEGLSKSQIKKRKKQMEKERAEREASAVTEEQSAAKSPVNEESEPSKLEVSDAPAAEEVTPEPTAEEPAVDVAETPAPLPEESSHSPRSGDEPQALAVPEEAPEVEAELDRQGQGKEAEIQSSSPPAEDDMSWAVGLTKSQIKKRKKQFEKEKAAAPEAEPTTIPAADLEPETPAVSEARTEAELSTAEREEPAAEAAGAGADADAMRTADTPFDAVETAPAADDDDWSSGLSKKEKKKKKKALALAMESDEPTQPESSEPSQTTAADEPKVPETQLETSVEPETIALPLQEPEAQAAIETSTYTPSPEKEEEDEYAGLSSKEKKKRKKAKAAAQAMAAADEAATPDLSEPPQRTGERDTADIEDETAIAEPQSADTPEAEKSEVPAEPPAADNVTPDPEEENEFAGLSSKEKKKRKKAKAKAEALAWEQPAESQSPEASQSFDRPSSPGLGLEAAATEKAPELTSPQGTEPEEQTTEPREAPQESQEPEALKEAEPAENVPESAKEIPEAAPEDEDEFAGLSKKEKKKRKKAKAQEAMAAWDEPTEPNEPTEPAPTEHEPTEPEPAELTPQEIVSPEEPAQLQPDVTSEAPPESETNREATMSSENAVKPDVEEEDEYAGLSNKEKKKRKKQKEKERALAAAWEQTAEQTAEPEAEPKEDRKLPTEQSRPEEEAVAESEVVNVPEQSEESPKPVDVVVPEAISETTAAAPDDDWGLGLSKKDKKKKKKEQANLAAMDLEPTSGPAQEPQFPEDSHNVDQPGAAAEPEEAPAVAQTTMAEAAHVPLEDQSAEISGGSISPAAPDTSAEAPVEPAADDEWGLGLSKKDKKKKQKQQQQQQQQEKVDDSSQQPESLETSLATETEVPAGRSLDPSDDREEAEAKVADQASLEELADPTTEAAREVIPEVPVEPPVDHEAAEIAAEEQELADLEAEKAKRGRLKKSADRKRYEELKDRAQQRDAAKASMSEPNILPQEESTVEPSPVVEELTTEAAVEEPTFETQAEAASQSPSETAEAAEIAAEEEEIADLEAKKARTGKLKKSDRKRYEELQDRAQQRTAAKISKSEHNIERQEEPTAESSPTADEPAAEAPVEEPPSEAQPDAASQSPAQAEIAAEEEEIADLEAKKARTGKLKKSDRKRYEELKDRAQQRDAANLSFSERTLGREKQSTFESSSIASEPAPEVSVEEPPSGSQPEVASQSLAESPDTEETARTTEVAAEEQEIFDLEAKKAKAGKLKKSDRKRYEELQDRAEKRLQAQAAEDTPLAEPTPDSMTEPESQEVPSVEPRGGTETSAPANSDEDQDGPSADKSIATAEDVEVLAEEQELADLETRKAKTGRLKKSADRKRYEELKRRAEERAEAGAAQEAPAAATEARQESQQEPAVEPIPTLDQPATEAPIDDSVAKGLSLTEPLSETPNEPIGDDNRWDVGVSQKEQQKEEARSMDMDWEPTSEATIKSSQESGVLPEPETAAVNMKPQLEGPQAEQSVATNDPAMAEGLASEESATPVDQLAVVETPNEAEEQPAVADTQHTPEGISPKEEGLSVKEEVETANEQSMDKEAQAEDDSWGPALSKKDKKKKKKGKALDFSAWDEPEAAKSQGTTPAQQNIKPEEHQEIEARQEPEAPVQQEPTHKEDEGFSLAGLSKKEKKKLKKQALAQGLPDPFAETELPGESTSNDTPEGPSDSRTTRAEPAEQDEAQIETHDKSAPEPLSEKIAEATHEPLDFKETTESPPDAEKASPAPEQTSFDQPATVQELDDWAPSKKLSKKEKKKAEKAAALAAALAADNDTPGETIAQSKEAGPEAEPLPTAEDGPLSETEAAKKSLTVDDEHPHSTETWTETSEEKPASATGHDTQPAEDDFGFSLSTKKSKKDKKKKQAGFDSSAAQVPEESKEIVEASTPGSWDNESTTQPAEPTAAEEDEWALPTKKGKKAKKSKTSQLAMSQADEGESSTKELVPDESAASKFSSAVQEQGVAPDESVDELTAGDKGLDSVQPAEDHPATAADASESQAEQTLTALNEPIPEETTKAAYEESSTMPIKDATEGDSAQEIPSGSPEIDTSSQEIIEETQPSTSQTPRELGSDDWLEGFATTKSKKKNKKAKSKATIEEPQVLEQDVPMEDVKPDEPAPASVAALVEESPQPRSSGFDQQSWSFPQEAKDSTMDDPSAEAAETPTTPKELVSQRKDESSGIASVVAAGAVAAGAAAMAEKASPAKKGKKGKKNKKSIDKRQPQEDDIFDDPSLWESADKRNLQEEQGDNAESDFWGEGEKTKGKLIEKENDDFWGGGEAEPEVEDERPSGVEPRDVEAFGTEADPTPTRSLDTEPTTVKADETWAQPGDPALEPEDASRSLLTPTVDNTGARDKVQPVDKTKEPAITPQSESFSGSDEGWKETAQRGVPLDDYDYDNDDSPILGRGEQSTSRSRRMGLLRPDSDVEEPVGGLLREDSQATALSGPLGSDFGGTRLSPARSLPGIREDPEAEDEPTINRGLAPQTPDMNRDSGYVESPRSSFHSRSRGLLAANQPTQEQPRDSGYHADDWAESPRHSAETPRSSKKLSRSSYGTPKLQEPTAPELTPEPEKKSSKSRMTADDYDNSPLRSTTSRNLRDATTPSLRSSKSRTERELQPSPSLRSMKSRDYGDLRSESKKPSSLPVAAGGAAAAAVAGKATASSQRSVSDNSHNVGQPRRQDSQPQLRRSLSNTSLTRKRTPEPLKFRPESPGIHGQGSGIRSTPTPPLRRVDKRVSGDLRSLRQQPSHPQIPPTDSASASGSASGSGSGSGSQPSQPVANEGRVRSKDMADVYDGFGEGRMGSPRSPTRPHSMRRRQSMQVLELESRVEQLMAENRLLTDARTHAEQNLSQRATVVLSERDSEIEALKQSLHFLQNEVSRLTEVNEGLTSANAELAQKDNGRYADLEVRHADVARELDEARGAYNTFEQSLQDKDAEIADLRAQLEDAKEQVREMQRQILASKAGVDADFLDLRDEDHFDNRCQQLCSHVQQWVLRFSKFSDMRACRLTSEINDEKTIDRLDNAVLDGSDVDRYLSDRVKRRDIFMSMTMNMIWEFVFTRYLFGMDREQRQKLKSLEKMLTEVGPPQAVRQWRAVTLTLLARRDNFRQQKDQDTEAVVQAIFQTLCKILPPPGNLENQIQSQLRRVLREAVDLSIEMRTQKAEYMMLPPLQPEYDSEGELAATVQFNASMMNERSGKNASTNEDLEAEGAVVRVVLFPLVVKKGDDAGVGDEEIVVCPAQVIVAGDKGRRSFAPSSDAGGASLGGRSHLSVVTEHMGG